MAPLKKSKKRACCIGKILHAACFFEKTFEMYLAGLNCGNFFRLNCIMEIDKI